MNLRQRKFVAQFKIHGNATQAAIEAGYSPKTAANTGFKLVRNGEIATALGLAVSKMLAKVDVTADAVLFSIARVAFADPRRLCHPDGTPKGLHELDDDLALAIQSVEFIPREVGNGKAKRIEYDHKIRFSSRTEAQANLARYFGLLNGDGQQMRDRTTAGEWAAFMAKLTPADRDDLKRVHQRVADLAREGQAEKLQAVNQAAEDVAEEESEL